MPSAAPRPCSHPGCGGLVRDGTGRCPKHPKQSWAKKRAKDDARYTLVHDQPCDYITAPEWKEAMVVSLATMGQSYNPVDRMESTGRILQIQPVHKSRVQPEVQQDGSIVYWLSAHRAAANARAAAGQCAPDTSALDLLADLQRRTDERAGELASIADEARYQGSACELLYEAGREMTNALQW